MPQYNEKQLENAIRREAKKQGLVGDEILSFQESALSWIKEWTETQREIKDQLKKVADIRKQISDLENSNEKLSKEQEETLEELRKSLSYQNAATEEYAKYLREIGNIYPEIKNIFDELNKNSDDQLKSITTNRDKAKAILRIAIEKTGISVEELKEIDKARKSLRKENENRKKAKDERRAAEKKLADYEAKLEEEEDNLTQAQINGRKAHISRMRHELEKVEKQEEEIQERQRKQENDLAIRTLNAAGEIGNKLGSVIDQNLEIYTKYMASMNARLQGGPTSYTSIVDNIASRLAISPFVKQKDVLQNIQTLVSSGVAFNVEQRGFLMTLADKIAPTFEAANETLLRLIRLQGEDTTAQRLGLEAALTRSLNATFKDTAYLNNLFDTIRDAIFDAESQLNKDQATELEYATQKWLSAMYSVGSSSTFITNLAQGINMLGTGDVTGLADNESMQALLAMALSRSDAGISYADILAGGLNASSANEVLMQVTRYLKEISESTNNQVVRSQYARMFGVSVADLNALQQLTPDMISGLYGQNINYQGFSDELTNQFWQLAKPGNRMSLGDMIQNAMDNVITGVAAGIAKSPALLTTWQLNSIVEDLTGGINIPFISAFGTGVDLNANLNQLIKLGIGGFSLMGQVGNIISSISSLGGLDLSRWQTEQNMRGGGFIASTNGVSTGLSSSVQFIGSGSYADQEQETLQTATQRAQDVAEVTNQGASNEGKTSDDIWHAMFDEDSNYAVRVKVVDIDGSLLAINTIPVCVTNNNATEAIPVQMIMSEYGGL